MLIKGRIMENTVFNPAQLQLLKMMSFVNTSEALDQLKQVISDFFAQKAQEEINRMWATGELNNEKVESFRKLHEHTSYQ